MTFWIIVFVATALAAAIAARPLFRRTDDAAPRAAHDAQIFRDQLSELDRDVARGVIDEAQAEGARLEIQRRLLAADAEHQRTEGAHPAPRGASLAMAAVLIVAAPIGAALLYNGVGAPGAADQPLAARTGGGEDRPDQKTAEAMLAGESFTPPAGPDAEEFRKLVDQLEKRLEDNPDDPQGAFLYARSLMQLGRFADAWPQFQRAIALNPDINLEARAGMAEGMILAAGGYISPEAEAALLQLLKRDPTNESARYYLGRLHVQADDLEYARAIWARLLQDSPPDAPWVTPVQRELASIGGTPVGTPATTPLRGPSQDDIAAASELPQDDQAAMVRTMVEGLANRIAAEGGSIQEYVQLIRSWQVLRDFEKAEAVLAEAREVYAGNAEAMAAFDALPATPADAAAAPAPTTPEPRAEPAPGPSAEDVEAAQSMPANDRTSMIEGMVQRLSDRLDAEGGSADEWLQLINSYNVLGRQDDAAEALTRARAALADDPVQLSLLDGATAAPGTAPPAPERGPSQEDMAAAAEMEPEDRQVMIRGMVSQLHQRLETDGRTADVNEWGKLMRSYKVLGDMDAIRAAYDQAIQIYADDAISLAYLKEAALLSGVKFN